MGDTGGIWDDGWMVARFSSWSQLSCYKRKGAAETEERICDTCEKVRGMRERTISEFVPQGRASGGTWLQRQRAITRGRGRGRGVEASHSASHGRSYGREWRQRCETLPMVSGATLAPDVEKEYTPVERCITDPVVLPRLRLLGPARRSAFLRRPEHLSEYRTH